MRSAPQLVDAVAAALGPLVERMVFVGGATLPFHLTGSLDGEPRPTDDVDVVVEVTAREYRGTMRDELLARGFREDESPGAPLCRWVKGELVLDLMPSDEKILGFANRWYADVVRTAQAR